MTKINYRWWFGQKKGWSNFKKYLKREYEAGDMTFTEWVELEIEKRDKEWARIDSKTQGKIIKFAKKLDSDIKSGKLKF